MSQTRFFSCSPGGDIAAGRRRLRLFLGSVAFFAIAVALAAAWSGRTVPALLAGGAGLLSLFALRMSADLDPIRLELNGNRLAIQMRRQREVITLSGATVRRLDSDEIDHLSRLATMAGITVGSGGFDSHRLGELDLYASDIVHAVLIDRGETSTVVTPDEPQSFIAALAAVGVAT